MFLEKQVLTDSVLATSLDFVPYEIKKVVDDVYDHGIKISNCLQVLVYVLYHISSNNANLRYQWLIGRSSSTIYVGNLPGDVRESEIEDLFYKVCNFV